MSDRMRLRAAIWRYRIRYDMRGLRYGFTHPGEVLRAYLRVG